MEWLNIKKNGCVSLSSGPKCIRHLQDSMISLSISEEGALHQVSFEILMRYSSHCISAGSRSGDDIDFNVHGIDRKVIDDRGNVRLFCDRRYDLSHCLPGIFEDILSKKCCFTNHENWLVVEIINSSGQPESYEVFFSLRRQAKKLLSIYVESAYVRSDERIANRPRKFKRNQKVSGKVLLAKTLRGDRIKRPR